MMTDTPESVTLVPIDRIEVLNSRDRNMKVFEEIVENIRSIGLKKPITVTEREGADGAPAYLLVCGEGRLNAFRLLGESHIPALVVKHAEENYGSELLNLVVAKGYLKKLMENEAVRSYVARHASEILEQFELVLNTVSMEEAVQQQLEADGEFEEDPDGDSDAPPTPENISPDSENGNETPVPGDNAATE